jgi:peptide/nickel transport system ATP-binding protein
MSPMPVTVLGGEHRNETVLEVRNLVTQFATASGVVHAVNGVSFQLYRGERLAIVGESGSGKSAMAMSLVRLLAFPGRVVSGEVLIGGRDVMGLSEKELNSIRGAEIGTIFQDPMSSLDPVMRIADQMVPPIMRHLGLSKVDAHDLALAWLDRVGIPDARQRIGAYPFEMSGGMRQRVMIAMALSCKPRLVIADEPTTALDVTIQAQIVELLKELTAETGTSMLFITHDLGLVARFAHKVAVMYAGRLVEIGSAVDIFARPRHPYSQSLLRTIPDAAGGRRQRLMQIPGIPPDMRIPIAGCAFRPRCAAATEQCVTTAPGLTGRGRGHAAACWQPAGLGDVPATAAVTASVARGRTPVPASPVAARQDVFEINNLHKQFARTSVLPWKKPVTVRAVNGVSLRLKRGETLGIVGESGCGKSTLARLLLGLDEPTAGQIYVSGETQMVFQDPYSSFNPKMKISSIIEEPLVVRGKGNRAERRAKVHSLISQVGLDENFLERYPSELSGGQRQRVAVARALALDPTVVVADEPTSALDVSVRAQIINLLCDLKEQLGVSFVFISHDLLTVRHVSDRIAVMYLGEVVEHGPADEIFEQPMHPYTRALLDAIPLPDPIREADRSIHPISGELPSPFDIPVGCAFASRCPQVQDRCRIEKPAGNMVLPRRNAACHFPISDPESAVLDGNAGRL